MTEIPEKVSFPVTKFCYVGTQSDCAFNCAVTKAAVLSQKFPEDTNGAHIRFSAQGLSVPYQGQRYIYQPSKAVFIMAIAHDEDNSVAAEFQFEGELTKVTPIKKASRARKDQINKAREGKPTKKYDRFASVRRALADGK